MRIVIIDAHCHAGLGDDIAAPKDTGASMTAYFRRADAAGITHSVLFAAPSRDYETANREVAQIVMRSPRRFLGFVFLHPVADRGRVARTVATAVDRWGFRGIKVHWRDGRMNREIADVAHERRLPILYDPGGDIAIVETVASAYPDVAWIIPHLSSFADDWKTQVTFVDQLTRFQNVFTDTSGVRYFDVLLDAVRRAGPAKILFGSDGPFLHPGIELAKIYALELDREDKSLVLGRNLVSLLSRVRSRTTARSPGTNVDRSEAEASPRSGFHGAGMTRS